MAVAAYSTGFAAREWDLPFILALMLGIVLGALVAFIPALLIGDAPSFSVIVVGLCSLFLVRAVIDNLEIVGTTVGFFGIPRLQHVVPVVYLIIVIIALVIYRIDHSSIGRAASVVFIDRDLASTLGINVKRLGIFLQTVAGAIGGTAGVIYGFHLGTLSPQFFGFTLLGTLLCILFVGGHTTMWGVTISAPLLWGVPLLLPTDIAAWRLFFLGGLLLTFLLVRPLGLVRRGTVRSLGKRLGVWVKKPLKAF